MNQYRVASASTPSPYSPHHATTAAPNSATNNTSSSLSSSLSLSSSSLPPPSAQDYPIRGTMSPLTCRVGGRRGEGGDPGGGGGPGGDGGGGGGGGEALSFVFGRPASSDAAVSGRCVSPPASLPPPAKRPLSPASRDALPLRRSASGGGVVVEREVLSPPPASSLSSSSWWGEGRMLQGGVCCEQCNGCLIELKRQALRLMFPDNGNGACLAQVSPTFCSCVFSLAVVGLLRWLVSRWVGGLVSWLVAWMLGSFICSIGRFVPRSFGQIVGWFVGWLVD